MDDSSDANQRLYPIQPNENLPFSPGVDALRRRVLIGILDDYPICLWFSTHGTFLRHQVGDHGTVAPDEPLLPRTSGQAALDSVETWKQAIGFHPQTIHISQFEIAAHPLSLYDLPQDYATYLLHLYHHRDQQPDPHLLQVIANWQTEGRFVLCWGNEYWMNVDGEVTDA